MAKENLVFTLSTRGRSLTLITALSESTVIWRQKEAGGRQYKDVSMEKKTSLEIGLSTNLDLEHLMVTIGSETMPYIN
eukprot:XP_019922635.1 PREDICTED: uncharacterized protein LOC105327862 [Crassostrea gigas]